MTDIRTIFGKTKFDVRACGILEDDGKVLISVESDGTKTLNGGAVKIGETTEDAVVREFFEETGLPIHVDNLVAIIENFFQQETQFYQQIVFVYRVSLLDKRQPKINLKDINNTIWKKKTTINDLQPSILNKIIQTKCDEIQHIILKD